MDWFEDEDEQEAELLERLTNPDPLKDLSSQQKSHALVISTRQQNSTLAKALIKHGANPNGEDEFGCTSLMFAATHGLKNCLELMLAIPQCIVNKRSHSMQTALHFAAKRGQVECVEMLLNNGAVVNVGDDWGKTPLLLGVRAGSFSTVKALVSGGARLEMTNLRGMDALMYAAQGGHSEVMSHLLQYGPEVNKVVKTSPLHQAALYGHVSCVEMLLEAGARSDLRDIHGVLPIELATHTDKHLVVSTLLKHDTSNEYRDMALASACKTNAIRCVHTLLRYGANPGATDMQGLPAFFWAVAQNNVDIVKCLIRHNVDVNKSLSKVYLVNSEFRELTSELDLDFVSAIVIAAFRDYCQMVKILVQAGANPTSVLKLWELGQLPTTLSSDTSLVSWLAHNSTRPRSLATLCRQCVREAMSNTAYQQIRELPLPKPIQDFLHYADLEQF